MDKGLLDGLSVLLCHTPPKWVLENSLRQDQLSSGIDGWLYSSEEKFISAFRQEHPERSGVEARSILQMLRVRGSGEHNIFYLILSAAQDYLRMDGTEVRCRHERMVEWRQATRNTGQSVFLCAFLAHSDLLTDRTRQAFSFAPYARTDHLRLRHMLDKGMAENHFHLRGSGPTAFLSWICLMNQIQSGAGDRGFAHQKFQRMLARAMGDEGEDAPGPGRFAESRAKRLCALTNTAAYLRVMLWRALCGTCGEEKMDPRNWFSGGSYPWDMRKPLNWVEWIHRVQQEIDLERMPAADRLDYLQTGEEGPNGRPAFYILSGEHRFLYSMFQKLYKDRAWSERFGPFFYAYLLIFFRFRRELIQCGDEYGFDNFQAYQSRKDLFLTEPFQKELLRSSFLSALSDPALCSLEVRITLNSKETSLRRNLERYINSIPAAEDLPRDPRAFFVIHLPKRTERRKIGNDLAIPYRNQEYREKYVMPQIQGLVSLFRSGNPMAAWVRGLDACGQEIGCRPEEFAPAFRCARAMAIPTDWAPHSGCEPPALRFTYHVGEDFLDMVDGLRAIDEAILFLDLRRGDRLGHALALGLDPVAWYGKRDMNMVLPAQDVLDNTAWLLHALQRLPNTPNRWLVEWLHAQFDSYCARIYGKTVQPIRYYQAWRLRGDDPVLYRDSEAHSALIHPWQISSDPRHEVLREQGSDTWELYRRYHFDPGVRSRGAELVSYCPPDAYVQAVESVQRDMQRWVARKGLGIETNPSSNLMIGGLERYEQHPIVAFNDIYLNTPPEGASLFVSINTDDQGIFDTDLENEFALMACALENAKGPDGKHRYGPEQVYRWLDQIRQMGIEQSFRQTEKKELSSRDDIFRQRGMGEYGPEMEDQGR